MNSFTIKNRLFNPYRYRAGMNPNVASTSFGVPMGHSPLFTNMIIPMEPMPQPMLGAGVPAYPPPPMLGGFPQYFTVPPPCQEDEGNGFPEYENEELSSSDVSVSTARTTLSGKELNEFIMVVVEQEKVISIDQLKQKVVEDLSSQGFSLTPFQDKDWTANIERSIAFGQLTCQLEGDILMMPLQSQFSKLQLSGSSTPSDSETKITEPDKPIKITRPYKSVFTRDLSEVDDAPGPSCNNSMSDHYTPPDPGSPVDEVLAGRPDDISSDSEHDADVEFANDEDFYRGELNEKPELESPEPEPEPEPEIPLTLDEKLDRMSNQELVESCRRQFAGFINVEDLALLCQVLRSIDQFWVDNCYIPTYDDIFSSVISSIYWEDFHISRDDLFLYKILIGYENEYKRKLKMIRIHPLLLRVPIVVLNELAVKVFAMTEKQSMDIEELTDRISRNSPHVFQSKIFRDQVQEMDNMIRKFDDIFWMDRGNVGVHTRPGALKLEKEHDISDESYTRSHDH